MKLTDTDKAELFELVFESAPFILFGLLCIGKPIPVWGLVALGLLTTGNLIFVSQINNEFKRMKAKFGENWQDK